MDLEKVMAQYEKMLLEVVTPFDNLPMDRNVVSIVNEYANHLLEMYGSHWLRKLGVKNRALSDDSVSRSKFETFERKLQKDFVSACIQRDSAFVEECILMFNDFQLPLSLGMRISARVKK